MSDDPSDALVKVVAEKAGEEVGTILRPVANIVERLYGDALEPGMKEVGKLVKSSISLLGAPLEWAEGKKAQIIADSLRRVPEGQRTEVPVALLGPVLDGALYHDQGTPLYEMFAELLARGFDSQRQGEAHPAYVVVLGQLSSDEARMLELASRNELSSHLIKYRKNLTPEIVLSCVEDVMEPSKDRLGSFTGGWPSFVKWEGHEQLHDPTRVEFYYEHLEHLGLVTKEKVERVLLFARKGTRKIGDIKAEQNPCLIRLTRFGRGFVEACIPETREWGW